MRVKIGWALGGTKGGFAFTPALYSLCIWLGVDRKLVAGA